MSSFRTTPARRRRAQASIRNLVDTEKESGFAAARRPGMTTETRAPDAAQHDVVRR